MPDYVIPQVEVFQDFAKSPAAAAFPLSAHIGGPHAALIRYAEPTEQNLGNIGTYDTVEDQAYSWPDRPAGGLVDLTYVQLWAKNAILRYFQADAGSGASVVKVAGKTNRVRSTTTNFKTSGSFVRDASLLDRDVAVGDVVKLRFTSSPPVTLWSYVTGFAPDPTAAITGTPTDDSANAATHTVAAVFHQVSGPINEVDISAASAAAYDPYPTGQVTETYTILVTGSSTGGDFTTATIRVFSASGLDDVASAVPAASGSPTEIGTHGATVTFNETGGADDSESAIDAGISPNDLLLGQKWNVTVTASHTATPAPTASGTYTGTSLTSYIVTVVKGEKFSSGAPQIQVSTTTGSDVSGPTSVTAASVDVPIGVFGISVSFAGAGLALGDRFYVPVTPAGSGPVRTLILGNTIPAAVTDNTTADISLFIRHPDLLIPQDQLGNAPLTNYDTTATELTFHAGAMIFDSTWTDAGVEVALPLDSDSTQGYTTLFVQARYWVADLCESVGFISDIADIDTLITGALTPDNPLKWAVSKALANSNGVPVGYTSVCDPTSLTSWANLLAQLLGHDDVYGLVPLSHDPNVWALYAAHCDDASGPTQGEWRVAWIGLSGVPEIPIVSAGSTVPGYLTATTSDGGVALATIAYDPDAPGTQYLTVSVPAANALFITNGVRPGDVVRAFFTTDGFGDPTFQSFTVDTIQTEETLTLLAGPAVAVSVPSKIEIWRTLDGDDEAAAIAKTAGAFGSRRVRAVWPDQISTGGTLQDGFHLCAALAGLASGVVPQQGMTNLAIAGFDDVSRTTKHFNKTELDTMAASGVWIVTQSKTGTVYTRHALTTGDQTDLNQREEMITRNVDSISFQFKDTFALFIGVSNVTPSLINILRQEVLALINQMTQVINPILGGQMTTNNGGTTIVALRQSFTEADAVVLILDLDIPYALNYFQIHLVIPVATSIVSTTPTGILTVGATTPTTTG